MEMKPTLTTAQKQVLVMTPKLQQAIKILQMPRLELEQYITQQIVENITLEETYDDAEEVTEDVEVENKYDEPINDPPESDIDLETGLPETDSATKEDLPELDIANEDFGDMDWKEYFADSSSSSTSNSEWEEPSEEGRRDNLSVVEESLQDHLSWQLGLSVTTDHDYEIGEVIIGEINDDGYLTADVEDIAESLGYDAADVQRVLQVIQGFDPTGVGGRNLEECLLIQLKQMDLEGTIPYKLIEGVLLFSVNQEYQTELDKKNLSNKLRQEFANNEIKLSQNPTVSGKKIGNIWQIKDENQIYTVKKEKDKLNIYEGGYLKALGANRYPQIAKSLGVDLDSVREAINVIVSLEPKPGRPFNTVRNESLNPDVIIEKVDGKYTVVMNDYGPRLGISPYYKNILNSGNPVQDDTRKFIQTQFESALWFLESLERRRKTIQKVTEAIFDVQKDFLEKGPESLKPLILKDVADVVGVHEATVSRVVNNRYVQTPQGIHELKHFFSSGISTKSGEMASSTSVKEIIKKVIDGENPQKPLSDKDIGSILEKKGFKIARRTIAKYREELKIPPSSKRKQW